MRLRAMDTEPMGSRYGTARRSPLGLGGTVAVHGALIGAFLLIPKEVITPFLPAPPIETYAVPIDPPPPVEPVTEPDSKPAILPRAAPERPTATPPVVPLPQGEPVLSGGTGGAAAGEVTPTILPPPPPLPDPVLTDAQIDPRALPQFQPDYPGQMIRQGVEGKVTVRVSITAQGRVSAIERIEASDEAFWQATRRHALRAWRFRPATRDGVAVASVKLLTVRFTLTER